MAITRFSHINSIVELYGELDKVIREVESLSDESTLPTFTSRARIKAKKLELSQIQQRIGFLNKRRELKTLKKDKINLKAQLIAEKNLKSKDSNDNAMIVGILIKELAKKSKPPQVRWNGNDTSTTNSNNLISPTVKANASSFDDSSEDFNLAPVTIENDPFIEKAKEDYRNGLLNSPSSIFIKAGEYERDAKVVEELNLLSSDYDANVTSS